MKRIFCYLLLFIFGLSYFGFQVITGAIPVYPDSLKVGVLCAIIGGIGGCTYCFRGIYLNACVRKAWDDDWQPWYYIRPIVSLICGGISYLFLLASLLVLESGSNPNSSELGFYALAFIAGLNVDKFIAKLEDLAQVAWGIEKSRTAKIPNPESK